LFMNKYLINQNFLTTHSSLDSSILKFFPSDVLPSSLIDSNVSLKWKQRKNKELGTRSLASTLGVEGCARALRWDWEEWKALNHSHGPTQNQTTSWLVHSWSTFGVKTSHEQTQTHKTHHGPDLGEATTFPLIIYFVPGHKTNT
jgi:hypothetical protein